MKIIIRVKFSAFNVETGEGTTFYEGSVYLAEKFTAFGKEVYFIRRPHGGVYCVVTGSVEEVEE